MDKTRRSRTGNARRAPNEEASRLTSVYTVVHVYKADSPHTRRYNSCSSYKRVVDALLSYRNFFEITTTGYNCDLPLPTGLRFVRECQNRHEVAASTHHEASTYKSPVSKITTNESNSGRLGACFAFFGTPDLLKLFRDTPSMPARSDFDFSLIYYYGVGRCLRVLRDAGSVRHGRCRRSQHGACGKL